MQQKVTMSMITNRASTLLECYNSPKYNSMLDNVLTKYNYNSAKTLLENWRHISTDPLEAVNSCLAVFEVCTEYETNPSHIIELGRIISEGVVKKVRNGIQLNAYLKNKIGRFKTKLHTKFDTRINNHKDRMASPVGSINEKIKAAAVSKVNTGAAAKAQANSNTTKEEAILSAYQNMQYVVELGIVCDTIINNQTKLEKRFNVVKTIQEAADAESAIVSICEYIDTYNMGLQHKYNLALQNIPYSIYKAGLIVDQKLIAETVTDYFLFTSDNPDIETMQKVLEHNTKYMYTTKDVKGLSYMFGDVANLKVKFDDTMVLIHEVDTSKITSAIKSTTEKFKDVLNEFKKSADKSPAKFKTIITKFYTQTPDQIIEGYPDMLGVIRFLVIISALGAINPILALAGACTNAALKIHFSRPQIDKYIDKQKKEIDKIKTKISNAKTDEDKEKFKKYKKQLEDDLDKLKDYRDTLYTEKEAEAIRDKESDDDIDFDDDDDFMKGFDMDFDECVSYIQYAEEVVTLNESIDVSAMTNKIYNWSMNHTLNDIQLESFTTYYRDIAEPEEFSDYMNRVLLPTKVLYETTLNPEDLKVDKNGYYRAKNYLKEECTAIPLPHALDPIVILNHYRNRYYGAKAIKEYFDGPYPLSEPDYILQEGFKETLQSASIQLRNIMTKLSDTEKNMSRTIDSNVNTFSRAVERAFTNDNREAVIRGSIIPSASKVIKMAIVTAAAWAVQPALAVIGVLGYVAVSKTTQAKERQLILDEIDTELQMTEKYLRIAEDKNDMKATRQLLRTQRDLQRQRQRVKYKMKVFNQRTNLTGGTPSSDTDN